MAQPGDFAYTVKTSVDIVRVIGDYVRLKKVGARYVGLCPFHQEKTPSFSVNGQFQFYKCFGCGAGGDVLKFVQEMERLTFPEAVRAVAEKAGIPIPKRTTAENDPQARLRAQLFDIHERAQEFFRQQLESSEGGPARHYITKRGLQPELVKEFKLGYAPGSGSGLVRLLGKDFPEEAQTASGLILKRDDGSGFFDRFRNRLIFPIHNEAGKVIAFGGRALRDEDQPKYLNSPETPIYRKSRVLYNIHRARDPMRKQTRVVLVEGYMDAIGVFSAGVHNVVASCGTSLTLEHVKQLAPMVKTVVVNYDPDSAGVAATERSLATLMEENLEVHVLSLPGGQDPDEFVKAQGAETYRNLVEHAPSFFDYLVERVPKMFDLGQPAGKAAGARHVLQYVSKLPDRIVRVEMATRLADRLGLDRDLLGKELRTAASGRREPKMSAPAASQISQVEKALLRYVVSEPEGRREVLPAVVRMLNDIPTLSGLPTRAIFLTLGSMSADDPMAPVDVAALADRLEASDSQKLALILQDEAVEPLTIDAARSCARDLARGPMQARIQELKGLIRKAEESKAVPEALRLLDEMKTLEKRLQAKDLLTFPAAP